ncbi:MATE family efflux transporter [Methanobrevibacter millerae]|uniref:MatE efflux family protein n=1 Tax=Methanobrevibacter millerae TaxID=230361 RepID=A0A0U2SHV4_9EURY|nr:MATE family efflux transporter [Methanobrevibacter millerae]ALT68549.1 MatE efflux family protein [Methanobrevibacter millerae]
MKEKIDLVTLPKKSFWTLSLPIIAFCIFDAIYGIVDMLWVSKISMEAFYAMGISIPFVTFVFSVGDSIGQGTNSIMSRFIWAGDYESSYNALIHGLLACNLAWFIIVLLFLFANGVLFYVDAENSYILIFDYLVPIIVFAYLFIFNNLFSETLQAEGNSRTPTALIIGSNILNLILDPIFIFNLNMGIKGAAYATVFSAFVVFIPILYLYLSGRTKVPLSTKYFKFRSYIIIEIFKVALPNFLDNALWLLSASYVNATLLISMNNIGPILYSV